MKIKYQKTKTLKTKDNSNSSDAISPSYISGCGGGCQHYCYVYRYNKETVYVNTNIDQIESSVLEWVKDKSWPKVPNQQDPVYYMIDIGCNSDLSLYQNHLGKAVNEFHIEALPRDEAAMLFSLEYILSFYDNHSKLNSTFATKYSHLLKLDVTDFNKKPRVRISLMPTIYSMLLEPKTTPISQRILDIKRLQDLGYEIHLNFSPVICYPGWVNLYRELFKEINQADFDKSTVKCEVIFLTNHKLSNQHELMKYSTEIKNSTGTMRYPLVKKRKFIQQFKKLHREIFPWCEIRYIF